MGVFAANRNLLIRERYDAGTGRTWSTVPYRRDPDSGEVRPTFGQLEAIGDNLTLRFQARPGLEYYF